MIRGLVVLLACLAAAAVHADGLPAGVDRVLRGHRIAPTDVSIVVQRLDGAAPALAHLPDAARNPASVMKLVTTWSALEILGPGYIWPSK